MALLVKKLNFFIYFKRAVFVVVFVLWNGVFDLTNIFQHPFDNRFNIIVLQIFWHRVVV